MNEDRDPMSKLSFIGLVILALVVSRFPFVNTPFEWVETFFHEISHGLMAVATGGSIVRIELNLDGSGSCLTLGGSQLLVTFAGYAGAVLWGALLYLEVGTASRRTARVLVGLLAVVVALSGVLWVRDPVSALVIAVILGLIFAAHRAGHYRFTQLVVRFIALYVMLSAVRAPLHLVDGRDVGDGHALASLTHVPELVWVLLWEAIALGGLWWVFRSHTKGPAVAQAAVDGA